MAEQSKAAAAKEEDRKVDPRKAVKVDEPEDSTTLTYTEHAQALVDNARELLKEEAKSMPDTDGPADNVSGDNSESPLDHVFSQDPYKKAFPPGPDDPSKLGK